MSLGEGDFASVVIRWQREHGRHDLPWQGTRDPYRVWLSEIMLQQTQVVTVLSYYERFLERFPDVEALAGAPLDEVLALWSGLGYYSRARYLHRCARDVCERFGGRFPQTSHELQSLPGIGRSTAAAIAAFCFGERAAILDGNVKRVLSRALGFADDLSRAANERALWERAQAILPVENSGDSMARYTQGLMDLGASVCLPRRPACGSCPLQDQCVARRQGNPLDFPVRTRTLRRKSESLWLLWTENREGLVWLERRPLQGIWAGLHCLPVFGAREELDEAVPTSERSALRPLASFVHVLTHRDLHLHPVRAEVGSAWFTDEGGGWFGPDQWKDLGLPAPIRKLLEADTR